MGASTSPGSKSAPGDWTSRLRREALHADHADFEHAYHVSLRPAFPPEYDVPGLVAVTFRLRRRPQGGHTFVTALDADAALRMGARLGLDEAESLAFVDSHERMHVALQVEHEAHEDGALLYDPLDEQDEERFSQHVDAVWLSLRHPRAAALVESGAFGLVRTVSRDFWERLVDPDQVP